MDKTNLRLDCRCGLLSDRLSIWFDDDLLEGLPAAYRDFEVAIGTAGQAWLRDRIVCAWHTLRGRRAIYGSVLLNIEDAKQMRVFLDSYIDACRRQEERAA